MKVTESGQRILAVVFLLVAVSWFLASPLHAWSTEKKGKFTISNTTLTINGWDTYRIDDRTVVVNAQGVQLPRASVRQARIIQLDTDGRGYVKTIRVVSMYK